MRRKGRQRTVKGGVEFRPKQSKGVREMTLETAIEVLEQEVGGRFFASCHDWDNAILLGIEALKLEKRYRQYNIHLPVELLPGETKE